MKSMNADKSSYEKDYSKVNFAYIAGLLDAEGNVYINTQKRSKSYVKITQKCDPMLIRTIQQCLGFGSIPPSEDYRIRFSKKNDILKLWDLLKGHLIVKKAKFEQLVQLLRD
jgi:hypothetical protein